MSPDGKDENDIAAGDGYEVLKIFGLKLKVKDPKIADLLTTDVKEDVSTFREKLQEPVQKETVTESQNVATREEIGSSEQFQDAINRIGQNLGFDVELGGIWRSKTGMAIILRSIYDKISFDVAKNEAEKLAAQQRQIKTENAGLCVTRDGEISDIIKAAIRSKNLYHLMRVVSYENLYGLLQLKESGYITHRQVVTLMVPLDNVDVGELLNIIKAAASPTTIEEYLMRKKP